MISKLFFGKKRLTHCFVGIPKNGSQSVRHAVAPLKEVYLPSEMHARLRDLQNFQRDLTCFAVVRNPWSRTVSRWQFCQAMSVKWPRNDERRKYLEKASFENFVTDRPIFEIPGKPGRPWLGPLSSWFNQLEWLTDSSGKVACTCLRFECLEDDLKNFFHGRVSVKHLNKTISAKDYRTMYKDHTIDIIAEIFTKDIQHFGFTFDGAATRMVFSTENRS